MRADDIQGQIALLKKSPTLAAVVERATLHMDEGEFREALSTLPPADGLTDSQRLRVLEIRALANERLYRRIRPPDPALRDAAIAGWEAWRVNTSRSMITAAIATRNCFIKGPMTRRPISRFSSSAISSSQRC